MMVFELRKRDDGELLLIDRDSEVIRLWSTLQDPELITDSDLKKIGAIKGVAEWGISCELLWEGK